VSGETVVTVKDASGNTRSLRVNRPEKWPDTCKRLMDKALRDVSTMPANMRMQGMATMFAKLLAEETHARIGELEARVRQIEDKGVSYRGSYSASEDYKRGDLVSYGGSIFHCTRDTQGVQPAHDGERGLTFPWQIAVKRGRDGKDFSR
jgi:hypothetical protein